MIFVKQIHVGKAVAGKKGATRGETAPQAQETLTCTINNSSARAKRD